jgi:hypothetical protein
VSNPIRQQAEQETKLRKRARAKDQGMNAVEGYEGKDPKRIAARDRAVAAREISEREAQEQYEEQQRKSPKVTIEHPAGKRSGKGLLARNPETEMFDAGPSAGGGRTSVSHIDIADVRAPADATRTTRSTR